MWSGILAFTDISTLLVGVVFFLAILYAVSCLQAPRNLPPGPWGLPVVGVLPFMRPKPHIKVQEWWARYGDIFSCYMGSRFVVVINGVDVMRECYLHQGDIFAGRPWNYFRKLTKNTGVVFTEGEVWKEHRRFTLSCMRDFGMGKISLERKIQEEVRYLTAQLDQTDGKPLDIQTILPKTIANIISSIIYGSRFEYSDPVFKANLDALDMSVRKQTFLGMINFIPLLEFLPKILPEDKILLQNVMKRDEYAELQIKHHKSTMDPDNPRSFIDAYLIRQHKLDASKEPTTFEERQLQRVIQDLFIAGSDTINTVLKWAFLFMALNPDVQSKVQAEIDSVVGQSRSPSITDRSNMPYTEATIMECLRRGNIAMFSVPRATLEDTTVNGYFIPKGTWVFLNRWGIHSSTKYWTDPKKFDPERFLHESRYIERPECFVPFGIGPRSCLGEILARMELFLMFTGILQVFRLQLPDDQQNPSLTPRIGLNMSPQPYQLCFVTR